MLYSTKVVLQIEEEIGVYSVLEKDVREHTGPVAKCCGPSGAETDQAAANTSLSSELSAAFNQSFANQNSILSSLTKSLSPTVAQGPNQQGFNAPELANLNTTAINNSAAAASNARRAAGNFTAGQGGGGTSGLQSGITQQIDASIDSNATNALANTQNAITAANYNQGRQNYDTALGGLQGVANTYNPTSFGSTATQAGSQAFQEQDTLNNERNAEVSQIAGGLAGVAGSAIGFANSSDALSSLGGGQIFGSGGIFGGG